MNTFRRSVKSPNEAIICQRRSWQPFPHFSMHTYPKVKKSLHSQFVRATVSRMVMVDAPKLKPFTICCFWPCDSITNGDGRCSQTQAIHYMFILTVRQYYERRWSMLRNSSHLLHVYVDRTTVSQTVMVDAPKLKPFTTYAKKCCHTHVVFFLRGFWMRGVAILCISYLYLVILSIYKIYRI